MRAALVTGPSSGIGRVTSLELGRKGSHVVAAGRSEERTSSVIDSIREEGGSAEFLHLGLASLESAREAARTFEASGRPLDVLVNNAGWTANDLFLNKPVSDFEREIAITCGARSIASALVHHR